MAEVLLRVNGRCPYQTEKPVGFWLDTEIGRLQGLHDTWLTVLCTHISQDGFVDRTCKVKLEVGVLSHNHIREILMRQHLQYGRRHFRASCLRVVTIPKVASVPTLILGFDVSAGVGKERVGKVA